MLVPLRPNERWSLDFVSDQFTDGRRFRVLAIVDDCTRGNLALVADTSLWEVRVARALDLLIAEHGQPKMIVSDDGSAFTRNAILTRVAQTHVELHDIAQESRCRMASLNPSMAACGMSSSTRYCSHP